ncbi:MAG: hypothetical protein ACLGIV_14540 [Actinomycetes bacterium]
MKHHVRLAAVAGIAVLAIGGISAPASATHSHVIRTPGTCVDRAGAGFGTGEQHDSTSFHAQVHKGTPGLFAFERDNNPVVVEGGQC